MPRVNSEKRKRDRKRKDACQSFSVCASMGKLVCGIVLFSAMKEVIAVMSQLNCVTLSESDSDYLIQTGLKDGHLAARQLRKTERNALKDQAALT